MIRTQIQLTEQQSIAMKGLAAAEHLSMAELIRRSIDMTIGKFPMQNSAEIKQRALAACGKFSSGKSDISVRHDDYLADIYEQ